MTTVSSSPIPPGFAISADAPVPVPDEWSEPYWTGLAEGHIVVQTCAACERPRFPRTPACPYCGAPGGDDLVIAGTGTVYSFVRVHRALTPASAPLVPYVIATVDLDAGVRMFGRVAPVERCEIGVRVEPEFVSHPATADAPEWTELCFRITG